MSVHNEPVIIEAAINGQTTKATNPNVPRAAEEIAADAIACIEAGAAVIHNHVDRMGVPGDVAAEAYLDAWRPVLAARADALVYPTVNIGAQGQFDYGHVTPLAASGLLRMSLCDPGSVNLGAMRDGVPAGGFVYRNSFDEIAAQLQLCHDHDLGPSIAIYEPGFLRTTMAWWRAGRLPRGAMVKLYFSTEQGLTGAPFGLPPTEKALDAYLEILDGSPIPWAASVVGGDLAASDVAVLALERGGHLHVGLEFYGGDRTPTNVELVSEAVALCERVGRPVCTPDEAAKVLDLPRR